MPGAILPCDACILKRIHIQLGASEVANALVGRMDCRQRSHIREHAVGLAIRKIVPVGIFLTALVLMTPLCMPLFAGKKIPPDPTAKPDLSVDQDRIKSSMYFESISFAPDDCAIVEGCVGGSGLRKLMRFDVAIRNVGHADLVLGSPVGNPDFEFSPCHGHYHFTGFVEYELYSLAHEFVVAGRKLAFCLEDYERIPKYKGEGNAKFTCSNQGITVGWQDVYRARLDCQWLDVTGIPPGDYLLFVAVDAGGKIKEEREDNNTGMAFVTIP